MIGEQMDGSDAQLVDDFAAGQQFQADVNAAFESMGVAIDSPEWTDYCARLAEWQQAVAEGSP